MANGIQSSVSRKNVTVTGGSQELKRVTPDTDNMTNVPPGFDFSFLNDEEARKILQVLERNEELKRAEKERIRYRKQILSLLPGPAGRGAGGGARGSPGTPVRPGPPRAASLPLGHPGRGRSAMSFPLEKDFGGPSWGSFCCTQHPRRARVPAGWGAPLPSPCGRGLRGAPLRVGPHLRQDPGWDPPPGVQADLPSAAPGSVASGRSRARGPGPRVERDQGAAWSGILARTHPGAHTAPRPTKHLSPPRTVSRRGHGES